MVLAGDPTVVGWTVFTLYLFASACCLHRGRLIRETKSAATGVSGWHCHAAVLLLLGVNKQLDLQTTLNRLGGVLARSAGWEDYRREIQLLFFVGLTAILASILVKHLGDVRVFMRKQPLMAAGDALLFIYVLIRVFTIEHVDERVLGHTLKDVPGLWMSEVFGLILCIAGATIMCRRGQPGAGD